MAMASGSLQLQYNIITTILQQETNNVVTYYCFTVETACIFRIKQKNSSA